MNWKAWPLSVTLFFLTLVSTSFIGGISYADFYATGATVFEPAFWLGGLTYALPLLAILLAHEMGHYLTARYHRMDVTPPYFIPAPTLIGTFGAFIRIRSPFYRKRDLFDVGIAGPLAGFVIAVPVLIVGMALSRPVTVPQGSDTFITFGEPVLYKLLSFLLFPSLQAGQDVLLHPTGFAGWIGLLVTSLNLLPVGQLDGGHIAYAVLGHRAHRLSFVLIGILLILSLFYEGWLVWVVLLLILGLRHPPLPYDARPLDPVRQKLAWTALLIFILSFMPVPIQL